MLCSTILSFRNIFQKLPNLAKFSQKFLQPSLKSGIKQVSQSFQRIELRKKIEVHRVKLRNIIKKHGKDKDSAISEAIQESSNLFDIAACHCTVVYNCSCPRDCKVSELEREFLINQRNVRKMVIESLDKETTARLNKQQK